MKKRKASILTILFCAGTLALMAVNVEYSTAELRRFSSYEHLKESIMSTRSYYWTGDGARSRAMHENSLADMWGLGGYSATNTQVEGVDEADFVKTDGEYIYVISDRTLAIVKAWPAEEATVLSRISANGTLRQMFVSGERLVALIERGSGIDMKTLISVYDISDRGSPLFRRSVGVGGSYFSSRMIGDCVYAVARQSVYVSEDQVTLPRIYSGDQYEEKPASEIYYCSADNNRDIFTTVVAVNVREDNLEPDTETILMSYASCIYVSRESIYVAIGAGDKTFLSRISIENGQISFVAEGEVTGTVLNQFSMDEYNGFFRIATTSQMSSSLEGFISRRLRTQNNLYVLDPNLRMVGRLEGVAPGETIHSVRFMGNMGYVVTFRKVDPFFAIDLSNPDDPRILGELKVTGYSDYLHPYDKNHVIGVGKETVAAELGDFSWYQGVKISLFDTTNVSSPRELAKYEIGDRGTDSPVLSDHKAFLFDSERNLLVLPVAVAEINEKRYPNGVPSDAYGETVWQGAYVFTVSLTSDEPIYLKGRITHIEDGNVYDPLHYVTRALYIGEVLYTVSNSRIKMNSLSDLAEINDLDLSQSGE